jgi:hypothetical protein
VQHMTIPLERTWAIRNARAFLRDLLDPRKTRRVPREIRLRASRVLRHFPSDLDILTVAEKDEKVFGADDSFLKENQGVEDYPKNEGR